MTAETFAEQVAQALGPRLVSLLLYGSAARAARSDRPHNTLLLVDGVDDDFFARLAPPVRSWIAAGHPPPLVLTEREWHDASDAFPIEYEDIREAHRVLAGRTPWAQDGVGVRAEHVRRQLEHELMGKLVHLRQAYAALWSDRARLAEVLQGTWAGFFTMLRALLRLVGRPVSAEPSATLRDAAGLAGFGAAPLERLAALGKDRPLKLSAGDPLPSAYLEAVARTAAYVNRLERTDS